VARVLALRTISPASRLANLASAKNRHDGKAFQQSLDPLPMPFSVYHDQKPYHEISVVQAEFSW
jgi:hypothetical protein